MKQNGRIYALGLLLFCAAAEAELNVIADLGGRDAAPFFEGINRQAPAS